MDNRNILAFLCGELPGICPAMLAASTVGFFLSFGFCLVIVLTTRFHGRISFDHSEGIQKVHSRATPRIGGLGLFLALASSSVLIGKESPMFQHMLIATAPAFFTGLLEDLTKVINPSARLGATFLSGLIACVITGYHLSDVDIPGLSALLGITWFSILFTSFAVAGIANSYNIIDGFNGLTSFTALIAFVCLGIIAYKVNDRELAGISAIFSMATAGFMLLNWPLGRIFLGDGGSYTLGFLVAWTSVLLVERNSGISAFAALLVCIYPVTEVIFSMIRRHQKRLDPSTPDRLHFHSLVGRRYINHWFSHYSPISKNSITGFVIAILSIPPAVLASQIYDSTYLCMLSSFFFYVGYVFIYKKTVRFKWHRPTVKKISQVP